MLNKKKGFQQTYDDRSISETCSQVKMTEKETTTTSQQDPFQNQQQL